MIPIQALLLRQAAADSFPARFVSAGSELSSYVCYVSDSIQSALPLSSMQLLPQTAQFFPRLCCFPTVARHNLFQPSPNLPFSFHHPVIGFNQLL